MPSFRSARIAAISCLLIAGGLGAAAASPLATIPVRLFSDGPYQMGGQLPVESLTYSLWVAPFANPQPEIGAGNLVLRFTLTEADVGATLVASALNMGPAFTAGAALLTNGGLADFISAFAGVDIVGDPDAGGGAGEGSQESAVPLDLRFQTVGSIKLLVDELTIDSPGSDPNHDGKWTDVQFNGRLVFDSDIPLAPVPAPASIASLAAGIALLASTRRRRPRPA